MHAFIIVCMHPCTYACMYVCLYVYMYVLVVYVYNPLSHYDIFVCMFIAKSCSTGDTLNPVRFCFVWRLILPVEGRTALEVLWWPQS